MALNYTTRKTLHILSNNSRSSTKEIAKNTKTTQQNASFKISKFEEDNLISYKLLVDSSKFRFSNYCVFIRLKNYSRAFVNNLTSELKKYKEIICIDFLFGNYDIFLKFAAPNTSHFNKILREILNAHMKDFSDYKILTQIVLYHYPLNFLSKMKYDHKVIISGDREYINIDKTNRKIINTLNSHARTNFVKIANQLNTTSKTVISRIKELEKKGIIKGYSINLNHKKLNLKRYYVQLKYNYLDLDEEKRIINYFNYQPNIIEFIKVFGEWDTILIIETLNYEDFKETIYNLKEKFSNSILDYSFLESEETKLWKYLPELEVD